MSNSFQNPFVIPTVKRRGRFVHSLKGLLVVALMLGLVTLAQSQTRHWLLYRWATGLADLPVGEQIERLLRIHQLGDLATETLVRRIAAEDDSVAETAVDLVRERQAAWSTRDDDDMAAAHRRMLAALGKIIDQLPLQRIGWVTQLANQTVIECVDQRSPAMTETYREANDLLAALAARTRIDTGSPSSLAVPSLVPLPVRLQTLDDQPALAALSPTVALEAEPVTETAGQMIVGRGGPAVSELETPAPVPASTDSTEGQETVTARHVGKTPLQTFSTRSVIGLLASNQAITRDQAIDELVRRGLSNEEIRIANQLAAPQVEVRLGLLESVVRRSDIDPRPWLLWLAEDNHRDVRFRAVTALEAMSDAAVVTQLRKRLSVEEDAQVIAALRQLTERR